MELIKEKPIEIAHFHQDCELLGRGWDKEGAKKELLEELNEWINEDEPNILSLQYKCQYGSSIEGGAWVQMDVIYQES